MKRSIVRTAIIFLFGIAIFLIVSNFGVIESKNRTLIGGQSNETLEGSFSLESRAVQTGANGEVPTGKIRSIDESKGIYSIEWQGLDGDPKSVKYTRPDLTQATVSASIKPGKNRKYRYEYLISNSKNSGQYLSGFIIQTFTNDVIPQRRNDAYVGEMATHLDQFKHGNWWRFGNDTFGQTVQPGTSTIVWIESDYPPVIVSCKTHGGPMKMIGVGEEIPLELEKRLLGYEAWPSGYTIGPSKDKQLASHQGRISYAAERLSEFSELGWIKKSEVDRYTKLISKDEFDDYLNLKIVEDYESKLISSELVALLSEQIGSQ